MPDWTPTPPDPIGIVAWWDADASDYFDDAHPHPVLYTVTDARQWVACNIDSERITAQINVSCTLDPSGWHPADDTCEVQHA